MDANTSLNEKQAWKFVTAFTGTAGQISFDSVNHLVLFDQDGNNAADFSIELTGVSSITAANFIL